AEEVDLDPERHVGFDPGAHEIGKVNAVADIRAPLEERSDRLGVGDVHRHLFSALECSDDGGVRMMLANDDRNPALEQVANDGGTNETGASGDKESHTGAPRRPGSSASWSRAVSTQHITRGYPFPPAGWRCARRCSVRPTGNPRGGRRPEGA